MIQDKYLQSFAHFYRGEMNRLTSYRNRLDSTFHYAIILTSASIIYYFNQKDQVFLFLIIFFNLFLCFIESRRYNYYLISQYRVALMEDGFLCHQIIHDAHFDMTELISSYQNPVYVKSIGYCFLIRYFRNYIWFIDLSVALWFINREKKTIASYIIISAVIAHHAFLFKKSSPDL